MRIPLIGQGGREHALAWKPAATPPQRLRRHRLNGERDLGFQYRLAELVPNLDGKSRGFGSRDAPLATSAKASAASSLAWLMPSSSMPTSLRVSSLPLWTSKK